MLIREYIVFIAVVFLFFVVCAFLVIKLSEYFEILWYKKHFPCQKCGCSGCNFLDVYLTKSGDISWMCHLDRKVKNASLPNNLFFKDD